MSESDAYGGLGRAFWQRHPLIGMVHLGPLPGSPRDSRNRSEYERVLVRAAEDAQALKRGGADAVLIENFFDAPFVKQSVPPHTVAAMTQAALVVRDAVGGDMPLGINVLRNDAIAAIAIAHIVAARFVRINVYVGAAVTDQGIIEGAARQATLYRRELGADVALWADIFVKHAVQLGQSDSHMADVARDAVYRGLADALIVSGSATGAATAPEAVRQVAQAVPETPVLVGSGFSAETAPDLLAAGASGAIVGTGLKRGGVVSSPVDADRVQEIRNQMR